MAEGGSGASGFGAARLAVVALALVHAAACGGGGGGGGGDDGGAADDELGLSAATTHLARDAGAPATADPRTRHRMQFRLRGLRDPGAGLTAENVQVRRDGRLDVESRIEFVQDDSEKRDLALVLDVSGSLTAEDLQDLKESAQDFVTTVLPVADELRIIEFASPSETRLVGSYRAIATGGADPVWTGAPAADIQAIDGGSDSTALFHAIRFAIASDAERDDILVLFSDGRENSSPPGAREEALALIDGGGNRDERIAVFTVGFGAVDADDLRLVATHGEFFGVRPSLVGLFDEAARAVLSIYTLVYDTPTAFGSPVLDVTIEAERRRFHFRTQFLAGVDLARTAVVRYPTLPGSEVVLRDLRTDPPTTRTLVVAPLAEAARRADGFLAFAIDPAPGCTGSECTRRFQGVMGAGAQSEAGAVYVPSELTEGATWEDPVTGETLTFRRFDEQVFFRGTDQQRRYRCAVVTSPTARYCFLPEIGLARMESPEGVVLVELDRPPCLAPDFSGACVRE